MTAKILVYSRVIAVCTLLGLVVGCFGGNKQSVGDGLGRQAGDEGVFDPDLTRVAYDPTIIMKRAEGFFDRKEYAEAVVEYQHFLELHKSHRLASYALYKLAVSHLNQIETIDRDPTPLVKADEILRAILEKFPESPYAEEATALHRVCYDMLAGQQVYVGRFYYRTGGYLAAIHRLEQVVRDYPEAEQFVAEALYYLALTYRAIEDRQATVEVLERLIAEYPDSDHRKDGEKILVALKGEQHPDYPHPTAIVEQRPDDWLNSLKSMLTFVP